MPDQPVTVEPTDWNENGITFAYAAETSTRPFTNNIQEWKEFWIAVDSAQASTTWPGYLDEATGMNTIFTLAML